MLAFLICFLTYILNFITIIDSYTHTSITKNNDLQNYENGS